MTPTILLVDDDPDLRDLLAEQIAASNRYVPKTAENAQQALTAIAEGDVSIVVSDLRMPGQTGTDLCREIVSTRPDIPVIIMTAFGSLESAVDSIRAGAYDFLTKPFEPEQLELVLDRAFEDRRLREELRTLRRRTSGTPGFEDMLGTSPPMQRLYDLIERIASSDASVIVAGESGTGKELVARALHRKSRRSDAPFVALNCAASADHLLESELFGQERGSSSDAKTTRSGVMQQAQGGTVFLDEIGDLSEAMQPKLLRALQERRIRPVGSNKEESVDLRLIAATHRDLRAAVESGKFRADLYYRLNVITVHVPPLRERGDDTLLLAEAFFDQVATRDGRPAPSLDEATVRLFENYPWPGNVRELKNCVERCVALSADGWVRPEHLPEEIQQSSVDSAPGRRKPENSSAGCDPGSVPILPMAPLAEVERRHILRVLDAVDGNKSRAAQVLGIDRKTLHARLQRYGKSG